MRQVGKACWTRAGSLALAAAWAFAPGGAAAEDGHELWLRHRPLAAAARAGLPSAIVHAPDASPTLQAAVDELQRGLAGMGGRQPAEVQRIEVRTPHVRPPAGALVLGTPDTMPALRRLPLPLGDLGGEGYLLRSLRLQGRAVTVVAANTDLGLLYGSYAWLRAAQTGADLRALDQRSVPKIQHRLLNHWDNLDRSVERGYAGLSLWDWWALPDIRDPRYVDYARANASLGINGTVLNNVNAKAESLAGPWLAKAAALADTFRPYGLRVYLSARFSAPVELGGLETADPLDPAVRAWWQGKADEIYRLIPDFGGFLVKANSEGQPGPQDYGRSHADGANMLAAALAPHGGLVLWRAFVYAHQNADDRAKQAYAEFQPLDGQFAANVILQVKNGAIDFQPREPFHPLFGAMPQTPLALELQITKEYLGFSTHLAYLGPLFEEVLRADTRRADAGAATVARVVDGSYPAKTADRGARPTAMAGVANIGTDRNWTGSDFDQANWYAYGRLAWDPDLPARGIAREWAQQTWSAQGPTLATTVAMMMASREAVVDYMTPLGLHHLMGSGHHHGPAPWVDNLERPDWNPTYYHRAGPDGIGFERGPRGSNAVAQYAPPLAQAYGDPATTPPSLLLWFHHLPWDYRLSSGLSLWQGLIAHYDRGVAAVTAMRQQWASMQSDIDPERHAGVAARLAVQEREARWWRDACLAYFQAVSGQPWPAGVRLPEQSLPAYQALRFPYAPGIGH